MFARRHTVLCEVGRFGSAFLCLALAAGCTPPPDKSPSPANQGDIRAAERAARHVQTGHVAIVDHTQVSNDGRWLLTASVDGETVLWDVASGRQHRTLGEIGEYRLPVQRILEISPDGKLMLHVRRNDEKRATLTLNRAESGEAVRTLRYENEAMPDVAGFSRDGRYICAIRFGSESEEFYVWRTDSGEVVSSPEMPPPYDVDELKAMEEKISAGPRRYDFSTIGNLRFLFFLRAVRPDGEPLAFARPVRMYNYTTGLFSPNGKQFITRSWNDTGSADDATTLWDVATATPIRGFAEPYDVPFVFAFHPSGSTFLTGINDLSAELVDSQTGQSIRKLRRGHSPISSLAFGPRGRSVLTGHDNGELALWNIDDGWKLRTWRGHTGGVSSVAYHRDGDRVLAGFATGNAVEYDVNSGRQLASYTANASGRKLGPALASYLPGGSLLTRSVHDYQHDDFLATLWDGPSRKPRATLAASPLGELTISPNGGWAMRQTLAPMHVWNLRTGVRTHSFEKEKTHPTAFREVDFSAVNSTPAQVAEGVRDWPVRNRSHVRDLQIASPSAIDEITDIDEEGGQWLRSFLRPVTRADYPGRTGFYLHRRQPKGAIAPFFWGSNGGIVSAAIGRLREGQLEQEYFAETLHPTAAVLTNDKTRLLVAYGERYDSKNLGRATLIIWDTETGRKLKTLDITRTGPAKSWTIGTLALSPNGRWLAMGYGISPTSNYRVYIYDLESNTDFLLSDQSAPTSNSRIVLFSPDSRHAVCFGLRRTLWDIEKRTQLAELGSYNSVRHLLFSNSGKHLFTTGDDGAEVRSCETGEVVRRFGSQSVSLRFSAKGDRMVAWRGEMKIGELWDYDNGKQICELTVPNGEAIIDALFVPDSDRLLTTHTNTVALWNSVTGELLNTRTDKQYPFEFFGNIQHPFFIDDGARLVTIKRSGASIWDTATGEPTHRLSTRPRSRTSVILGNRPNTLLTVTPGGSASLWDLESGEKLVSYRGVPQDITTARNYIRFSKNGERLLLRHRAGQAIICWDARTGKQVERWFLVNHGNDVLIENSITGEYVGSPAALRAVVAD